jgi:uncharacterized protein (DUF1778 family)
MYVEWAYTGLAVFCAVRESRERSGRMEGEAMVRNPSAPSAEHGDELARERLAVRLSPQLKQAVMRAAQVRGESLTDFVLRTISDAAWTTLRDHDLMTLSERDTAAFLDALAHPANPNDALQTAAARYAARFPQP